MTDRYDMLIYNNSFVLAGYEVSNSPQFSCVFIAIWVLDSWTVFAAWHGDDGMHAKNFELEQWLEGKWQLRTRILCA